MCGIAGIFSAGDGPAVLEPQAAQMASVLGHRGPNDTGTAGGEGWAMGMTRLAVQDPSPAGHQPMRRGDLITVFNGEVYNFPELRGELEARGDRFSSGTDTEVVLRAFEAWGTDAFERFNGMFAIALVDTHRRRAWLARDRFGKKPLFLAQVGDRLLFASELKSIVAIARNSLSLDRRSLARFFRLQYVPTPHSIFEGVSKLPPSSFLEVELTTARAGRPRTFWRLPEHAADQVPASTEEVVETVGRSVRRRLVADVPVGAFLSGGTDSSLVVASMRMAGGDVRTFSIGFDDPRFDESGYARAVADNLETTHVCERLTWREALETVPRLSDVYDEPFADSSAIPTLAVAALARESVTVALSGDGGDELFGGYLRYRAGRYLRRRGRATGALSRALGPIAGEGRLASRLSLLQAVMSAPDSADAYQEVVSVWRSRELRALMPGLDTEGFAPPEGLGPGGGVVEQMMRWDARTYLMDDILQKVDRATMAVSLEARNPLLDPEVVELAFRSVSHAEKRPGEKPLLRSALRGLLPDELVDRPKKGFGVPLSAWLRTDLRPLVEDLVLSRQQAEYDLATAKSVCRDHLDGRREAAPQVWGLLAFELWRDRWLASS